MPKLGRIDIFDVSILKIRGAASWLKARMYGKEYIYVQVPELPLEMWPDKICNHKQLEMYDAIVKFKTDHGYAPIYQELVEITGRAIATVQKRIKELEELGLIEYLGGRMIKITGEIYLPPFPSQKLQEKDSETS